VLLTSVGWWLALLYRVAQLPCGGPTFTSGGVSSTRGHHLALGSSLRNWSSSRLLVVPPLTSPWLSSRVAGANRRARRDVAGDTDLVFTLDGQMSAGSCEE
jgi:hypothetical protein